MPDLLRLWLLGPPSSPALNALRLHTSVTSPDRPDDPTNSDRCDRVLGGEADEQQTQASNDEPDRDGAPREARSGQAREPSELSSRRGLHGSFRQVATTPRISLTAAMIASASR